jgi:DNA-binding beta-propeller fold protein YncE
MQDRPPSEGVRQHKAASEAEAEADADAGRVARGQDPARREDRRHRRRLRVRLGADRNRHDTLVRIDPATNAVVARIAVPKGFGIAAGETAVWTSNFADNTLSRIDPATNTIAATIALSDVRPAAITTTAGSVWVGTQGADNSSGWMFHISSVSNAIIEGNALPDGADGASDVAWSGGALRISGGQALLRASDTTLNTTVVREIANQNACGGVTSDATTVWIAGGNCGFPKFALAVVTSADGKTVATPAVPTVSDVAIGQGAAWATTKRRGSRPARRRRT